MKSSVEQESPIVSESVYFSEPTFDGPANSAICYQIVNIATNASKVVSVPGKMEPLEALCWFRPNIWIGGM
jgi:hypothetical protein